MYVYICICIYIYIVAALEQISRELEQVRLTRYIYIDIYMYVCMYVCIYIAPLALV